MEHEYCGASSWTVAVHLTLCITRNLTQIQTLNASLESIIIWHNCIPVSPRLTKRPPTYLRACGKATALAVAETQARHWWGHSLDGSLLLRCSGLSLMIYARHLQESWLHYRWCFKMCFKAYFSHSFNLHRQHPYLLTTDSPMHSFPTTGLSCNISLTGHLPWWEASHTVHMSNCAHAIPTPVFLLSPMDKVMAVSKQSLLLVKSTSFRTTLPGHTVSVLYSF